MYISGLLSASLYETAYGTSLGLYVILCEQAYLRHAEFRGVEIEILHTQVEQVLIARLKISQADIFKATFVTNLTKLAEELDRGERVRELGLKYDNDEGWNYKVG